MCRCWRSAVCPGRRRGWIWGDNGLPSLQSFYRYPFTHHEPSTFSAPGTRGAGPGVGALRGLPPALQPRFLHSPPARRTQSCFLPPGHLFPSPPRPLTSLPPSQAGAPLIITCPQEPRRLARRRCYLVEFAAWTHFLLRASHLRPHHLIPLCSSLFFPLSNECKSDANE